MESRITTILLLLNELGYGTLPGNVNIRTAESFHKPYIEVGIF